MKTESLRLRNSFIATGRGDKDVEGSTIDGGIGVMEACQHAAVRESCPPVDSASGHAP
jgi:hypothetical protein